LEELHALAGAGGGECVRGFVTDLAENEASDEPADEPGGDACIERKP
jgi:hypothetical protein